MKTAVSVPDEVFAQADRVARDRGWSRSQLYTRALEEFLAAQGDDPVTVALDALADEMTMDASPAVGRAVIDAGAWEW